jgi:predicted house-cleaning noncanonical NTP pyrophosphatase (MazG superfamily)
MFKLVRDKIPEIMLANGQGPVTKTVTDDVAYDVALRAKLLEEVHEFIEAASQNDDEHAMREIADVLEVIEAICHFKKYEDSVIQSYKANKKRERGGFEKRILLVCSSVKKD